MSSWPTGHNTIRDEQCKQNINTSSNSLQEKADPGLETSADCILQQGLWQETELHFFSLTPFSVRTGRSGFPHIPIEAQMCLLVNKSTLFHLCFASLWWAFRIGGEGLTFFKGSYFFNLSLVAFMYYSLFSKIKSSRWRGVHYANTSNSCTHLYNAQLSISWKDQKLKLGEASVKCLKLPYI